MLCWVGRTYSYSENSEARNSSKCSKQSNEMPVSRPRLLKTCLLDNELNHLRDRLCLYPEPVNRDATRHRGAKGVRLRIVMDPLPGRSSAIRIACSRF